MRYLSTLLLLCLVCTAGHAQRQLFQPGQWLDADVSAIDGDRRINPARATTFSVDGQALKDFLFTAPHERKVAAEGSETILGLRLPDGRTANFRIVSYNISEPAGMARYPNIRTFYGVDEADPTHGIFLDWTERGFHASIKGGGHETVFIDPVFRGDTDHYQAYRKKDFNADQIEQWTCQTTADQAPSGLNEDHDHTVEKVGGCELREYRFTMTATSSYSTYHGASSAAQSGLVQSAVVTTVNRVNQVYSREISVRFQLVADNDQLYGYGSGSAPFSSNDVGTMFNENTSFTTDIIGLDNYDYGHSITQGPNNGIGQFEAPCSVNSRAQGASSHETPEADIFDIDYVAHEMGHNFNGRHTQNNACNRDESGSTEPGSGHSIMGYAGICSPNVQDNSDDFFHGRSIEQMTTFSELGGGAGCGTIINTTLSNASVTPQTDETIPAGTPFVLKADATGDGTLSYNWEQNDSDPAEEMPPASTNERGPLFRGFNPSDSPERFFPVLSATIAGEDQEWEVLPEVDRTLNFRGTVINYNASYGCASEDDVRLTVDASTDPFVITDPADGNQLSEGQVAQVQWDIAGTDAAPFNSQEMDILLSKDGGVTFDALAVATANDGIEEVTIPAGLSSQARIMVRSADNVFFNVSPQDFTIVSATTAAAIDGAAISNPDYADCFLLRDFAPYSILTSSAGGAEAPITWSITGLPADVTPSYSVNPSRPGGRMELLLNNADLLPLGQTDFTLTGTSADGTITIPLSVTRTSGDGGAGPDLISPVGGFADIRPALTASSENGVTFQVQLATDPEFMDLVYDVSNLTEPRFSPPAYLDGETQYYWRIREGSECGTSAWSTSSFRTNSCDIIASDNTQVPIFATQGQYDATKTIFVPASAAGEIADVDVFRLSVTNQTASNLTVLLEAPSGDSLILFDRDCGSRNGFDLSFDDEAASVNIDCSRAGRTNGLFYRPRNALSLFDGTEASGTWRLTVTDNFFSDGGVGSSPAGNLNSFQLKICRASALPVTFLEFTARGTTKAIELAWATEDEVDNEGFYIERRGAAAGAGEEWQAIGFVAAGREYAFRDETALPNTDYLYRLRQVDFDGTISYSPIEAARYGEGAAASLAVFPNPSNGLFNYRFGEVETTVPYQLMTATGQLLESGTLLPDGGTLDLRERATGVYLLRAGGETRRVVVF
ncbi:reprolysin-like metallopeptidase [Lewinella sp. 4G2]|uniref:reprolysin-like metallopeptidase n=1 Tax=Lewinella sp. 4G2 TaxID=1803372 RepID=UPI0007B472EB|nr:zinc-dependent metalloprotease family protein [Lewinella sp. 4G2]OAV44077.1 hypothetical protein A3850_006000 [Lewinella sp. 4G2]